MIKVGNWVLESTSTLGTGTITLLGALSEGFARFRDALPASDVYYSIEDGANREAGVGTFNGTNQLIRTTVKATFVNGVYNDTNPTAITLSGAAVVACTFNTAAYDLIIAHIETTSGNPHGVVASEIPYDSSSDPVTNESDVQSALLDHGLSIEERVPSLSGLISGGRVSGLGTQFDISAGTGTVYDNYTDVSNTGVTPVEWLNIDNTVIETGTLTVGNINLFITAAGNVLQILGEVPLSTFRDNIFLCRVYFKDNFITEINEAPAIVKQTATDVYDLLVSAPDLTGVGIRDVNNELQVWNDAGSVFYPGINWYVDKKNPNVRAIDAVGDDVTPVDIVTMTQTGLLGVATINDIPKFVNDTGDNLVALGVNSATIHRLYILGIGANRTFLLLYGQYTYSSAGEAQDSLDTDNSDTLFPDETDSIYFLGHICVEGSSTDFSNVDNAWILNSTPNAGSSDVITSHTALTNRDVADQHPQSAITDLNTLLVSDQVNLSALDRIINASTLADVFIYDTSQDDDGGAWVDQANSQSWFNEALNTSARGATKAFPKLALITLELSKVIIYDGTKPDCPMWMAVSATECNDAVTGCVWRPLAGSQTVTSVVMRNGKLYVGHFYTPTPANFNGGVSFFDFKEDIMGRYCASDASSGYSAGPVSGRDSADDTNLIIGTLNTIVNSGCNDIAVTSDGHMNNTVAVATDGGASVIHPDGNVADIVGSLTFKGINTIFFTPEGLLGFSAQHSSSRSNYEIMGTLPIPLSDLTGLNYRDYFIHSYGSSSVDDVFITPFGTSDGRVSLVASTSGEGGRKYASSSGVCSTVLDNEIDTPMVVYQTADYLTGYMHGDIKGAFLANSKTADRSVNNKPLVEVGTVTESPVATGAELMAYSGFSATDYLEGTDASYVDTLYNYGWVESITNGWEFKHGIVSASDIDGLTIVATVLHIEGTLPKALIRIGSQPSAEQLAEIELAERPLFNENAKCLLQGASSDVKALAYSESDDILTVCTADHLTRFNGLIVESDEATIATSVSRACGDKEVTGI